MNNAINTKRQIIGLASTWRKRSDLSVNEIVARVQKHYKRDEQFNKSRYERYFGSYPEDLYDLDNDLIMAFIGVFADNLLPIEKRCQPKEAVEFAILTRLNIRYYGQLAEWFKGQEDDFRNALIEQMPEISVVILRYKPIRFINTPQPALEELFGREKVLYQIWDVLEKSHSVCLYGQGGMGKTALAVRIADEYSHKGEKVIWIAVGEMSQAVLYDTLGQYLGSQDVARVKDDEKLNRIRRLLETQMIRLLILDNIKNVDTAIDIQNILPPNCSLIITSRKPALAIKLTPIQITTLDETDSIVLFRKYAQVDEQTALIHKICSLLSGYPLALELAGKKAFKDGLENLDTSLKIADTRSRSIIKTIDIDNALWTAFLTAYDDLNGTQQTALKIFGQIWANTLTIELISMSLGVRPEDISFIMADLVARGLVKEETVFNTVQRYRIHDLTQDFLRELQSQPSQGHLTNYQRKILVHLRRYVDNHANWQPPEHHDYLDAEKENIMSAVQWALEQQEWKTVEEIVLNLSDKSRYLRYREYTQATIDFLNIGIKASEMLNNNVNKATFLRHLGWRYNQLGEREKAIELYHEALSLFELHQYLPGKCLTLLNLGVVYIGKGLAKQAIDYYQEAREIAETLGDKDRLGIALLNLGTAYHVVKEYSQANDNFQEALPYLRASQDWVGVTMATGGQGWIAIDEKRPLEALKYYQEALEIVKTKIGSPTEEAGWLGGIGEAYMHLNEFDKALEYHQRALEIDTKFQNQDGIANHHGDIGKVYIEMKEWDNAVQHTQKAYEIHKKLEKERPKALWLHNLGKIHLSSWYQRRQPQDLDYAIAYLEEAKEIREGISDKELPETLQLLEDAKRQKNNMY